MHKREVRNWAILIDFKALYQTEKAKNNAQRRLIFQIPRRDIRVW